MIIGKRRAREMALQMLYQQDLGGRPADEILASFDPEAADVQDDEETGGTEPGGPAEGAEPVVDPTPSSREQADRKSVV